jgi:hypothetical protein
MLTMMDEIFDRVYQDNRGELNAGISKLIARVSRAVRDTFEVLIRIEYNSPWTAKQKRVRAH